MNDLNPFTDASEILSMEAEHLPLWRAFIRAFAPLLPPGGRILDFGCSRGGMLLVVFEEGADATGGGAAATFRPSLGVGIDVDARPMCAHLEASARAVRGRYPLLFTTSSPRRFPGQFDLAVSHEVVYLLPDLRRTFAEIALALTPNGRFCLTTGCHAENPLFPRWRASLEQSGISAHEYTVTDYEGALLSSGFRTVHIDRLRLTPDEYDSWILERGANGPNPAWFPSAAAEREYYTGIGKLLITAERG
jgi:SAM-dependent methyltransferase